MTDIAQRGNKLTRTGYAKGGKVFTVTEFKRKAS